MMASINFKNGSKAMLTNLEGCYIINPRFFGDKRGYYVADFIKEDMEELGFKEVTKHTEDKSAKNVLRRMELKYNGEANDKIIRAVAGDALAIVIDAREDSKTVGEHTLVHLTPYDESDELSGKEVLVPSGCIHAVLSLKDNTHVQEFSSESSNNDVKTLWNDEDIRLKLNEVLNNIGANMSDVVSIVNESLEGDSTITPTELEDCFIVRPSFKCDEYGFSVSDYQADEMKKLGFDEVYQHSESKSAKNVLRGMHFQLDPKCQAKLVRVVKGEVIDVVVDVRKNSPTYGKATYVHLKPFAPNDETSGLSLYVPRGFAHGFISLTDDAVFQYFVDNSYAPELEDGIAWDGEETLEIFERIFESAGIGEDELIVSDKDQHRLALKDKQIPFKYNKKNESIEYSFEVGV